MRVAAIVLTMLLVPLAAAADGIAGMSWDAPQSWAAQGQRPMRAATYVVPGAGGAEEGECAVFYFGRGQGGSVEANVQRWIGQFEPSEGSSELETVRSSDEVNGISMATLEVTGTFLFKPFPAAPQATRRAGYRMLAAIVEGPEGPVFFKLTAPKATTDAAEADFEKMLASLRSGS
ncbi:MAG: hypothetical protein VYE73_15805 [Acidobacteriota bacterium]|nr:hypothetical protein [Acidobacteriota bacterium]